MENGLTEYEFDHVFAGEYNGKIAVNQNEVASYEYVDLNDISEALKTDPKRFTSWFKIAFPMIGKWWESKYAKPGR